MGSSAIQSHAPAPTPPVPSGILGSTSAWFSWCCSSQDTLRWSTPLLISSLGFRLFEALTSYPFSVCPLQCLFLWFACSGNICWTELFLHEPFHVASVLRSVSFGWRLGEICSPRSVESFRYRGALLCAGCPLFLPRGFAARRWDEASAHVSPRYLPQSV